MAISVLCCTLIAIYIWLCRFTPRISMWGFRHWCFLIKSHQRIRLSATGFTVLCTPNSYFQLSWIHPRQVFSVYFPNIPWLQFFELVPFFAFMSSNHLKQLVVLKQAGFCFSSSRLYFKLTLNLLSYCIFFLYGLHIRLKCLLDSF